VSLTFNEKLSAILSNLSFYSWIDIGTFETWNNQLRGIERVQFGHRRISLQTDCT
jgi:hypothetical protein